MGSRNAISGLFVVFGEVLLVDFLLLLHLFIVVVAVSVAIVNFKVVAFCYFCVDDYIFWFFFFFCFYVTCMRFIGEGMLG